MGIHRRENDARTYRIAREFFFLKRTERRVTASFFERLKTWRMMLGAMGRRRSRAEAMMMMDAMMAMDDVSTAFLGCGGGTRNERVIPRVEETTRGFLITVSYRRPKHLRRSTTMAESKTSPNNENIYATFTQHLRNIYTTFCNARTH